MTTQPKNQFPPEFYAPEFWQQYPKARYAHSNNHWWTICENKPVYHSHIEKWTTLPYTNGEERMDAIGFIKTLLYINKWKGKPKDSLFVNPFIKENDNE